MENRRSSPGEFPVRWPQEYLRFARTLEDPAPLLALGEPREEEEHPDPEAFADPTGERSFEALPCLLRKHPDRALLLVSRSCFFYCRFCFRRGALAGGASEAHEPDLRAVGSWLSAHPEVEELVLSGGDPLTLSDDRLRALSALVASTPTLKRWRIHTRAPVVFPERVSGSLVASLRAPQPLRVVLHTVHPAEVRPTVRAALGRLRAAGHGLLNQTVLLAGVNASPAVLAALFGRLGSEGVGLHYLHHPDRAPGTRRFRLTLEEGLRIYREVEAAPGRPGTQKLPPYVVDLPNGAGKVPVASLRPVAEEREGARRRLRYRWTRDAGWSSLSPATSFEWWDVWGPSDGSDGAHSTRR